MAKRSLLSRAKISEFQKGIHDNIIITNIDTKDRKGQNGPINKMVYIKFAQLNDEGRRVAESELAWWKPDPTSEYFVVNLQEMCLQLHNVIEAYAGEDAAFDAFKNVFDDLSITSHEDISNKKWKQSEVNTLNTSLKTAFNEAMVSFVKLEDPIKLKVKITTNYKGEGVEIPKYGKFIEVTGKENSNLKFTASELKTHSKSGIVSGATNTASSLNAGGTI